MATLGTQWPTLVDIASRLNPDGTVATPAEIMAQTNEILQDFPVLEGNLPTGHRESIRTGLPISYWRRFNQGVPLSKSRTQLVTDAIGMMEQRSNVDKDMAELNGNSAAWRKIEDTPHLESMAQKLATTIIYGNELVDTDEFTGFAARYCVTSGAEIARNVIDAGGTSGELTSIWLIFWNDDTTNMRYSKGSAEGGITSEDLGELQVNDSNGNTFSALSTKYVVKLGLSVKDWRYVVRIANIPVATLNETGSTGDLWNLIIKAMHIVPTLTKGKGYLYMNRTVRQYLDLQSFNKPNIRMTQKEINGKLVDSFRDIPFRTLDILVNTEQRVVAAVK